MASRHDRAFEIMRRLFPDEFAPVEKRIAHEYAQTHNRAAAMLELSKFAIEIQRRYFYQIAQAPDDDLVAIGIAKLAQYRMLQRIDPIACYELGEDGSVEANRRSKLMEMKRDPGTDTGTPQFLALLDAREHPVTRGPLTQEDMEGILDEYRRLGGSMAYLESLKTDSGPAALSPEDRCENVIVLNEAVKASPKGTAARFWAQSYRALGEGR